jgi:hypothetical protein
VVLLLVARVTLARFFKRYLAKVDVSA